MQNLARTKQIVISGLTVLLGLLASTSLIAVTGDGGGSAGWIALIALILFLSLFALQTILLSRTPQKFIVVVIMLQTFAFGWPLLSYRSFWFFLFGGIAFLLFLFADRRGRELINELTKIRFGMLLRTILPAAITAVSIMSVMFLYEGTGVLKSNLVSSSVSASFKSTESLLARFSGGASFEEPLNSFLQTIVQDRFRDSATPEERNQAAEQAFIQIQNSLAQSFHIAVSPNDRVIDIIERVFAQMIQGLSKTLFGVITVAIVLFLIVRGIGSLVSWAVIFVSWTLLKILLATKFCKITVETCEKESILLS